MNTSITRSSEFLGHPKGLFICFFTEMWERFSYYGMRAILIFYLTKHWDFSTDGAYIIYGSYTALVYMMPIIGGMLADQILGSRKSVIFGGILLVIGHLMMTIESNLQIFYLSLALIISGVGFLKPNISTIVGELYPEGDSRRDSGFTIFYMGINIGAATSAILCGYLGEEYGWSYGFGAAGIGMIFGLIVFVWGQKYLEGHAEPPSNEYMKRVYGITKENWTYLSGILMVFTCFMLIQYQGIIGGMLALIGSISIIFWLYYSLRKCNPIERDRLLSIGVLVAFSLIFWALFEQAGSSLNILTDRGVDRSFFGKEVPASIFQSLNAIYIITLAPVFAYLWLFLAKKNIEPSIPQKFSLGLFFVGLGFLMFVYGGMSGNQLDDGSAVKIGVIWIFIIYLVHTIGELCLSPVGLSSVTKLSPKRVVGIMMGMWFLASAAGNYVAALIATATSSEEYTKRMKEMGDLKDQGLDITAIPFLESEKIGFIDAYTYVGWGAIGFALLLLILSPHLKKMMHGIT
jgi:POT family proton-dependent oligopeptide transporter